MSNMKVSIGIGIITMLTIVVVTLYIYIYLTPYKMNERMPQLRRDNPLAFIHKQIQTKDSILASLKTQIKRQFVILASLHKKIEKENTTLESLPNQIRSQNATLQSLQTKIETQNTILASLRRQMIKENTIMVTLHKEIKTENTTLAYLHEKIQTENTTLAYIHEKIKTENSTSTSFHIQKQTQSTTLEVLHKQIQSQIQSLQEYGNCDKDKILICKNEQMYAGFGTMTMRYGMCMQIAFGLGRIAIIHEKMYEHFGNYAYFFDYLPKGCSFQKAMSSKSICFLKNPSCYINGYDVDNTYKVLVFGSEGEYTPYPRHVPGTIPLDIETRLKEHGIVDPWMWFTSQFFGYLLLRLKPDIKRLYESFQKKMNLPQTYVAMHIRQGDKIIGKFHEAIYVNEKKFVSIADKFYNQLPKSNSRRKIFVASDNNKILDKLRSIRPDYEYVRLPNEYMTKGSTYTKTPDGHKDYRAYTKNKFPKEIIESMIIDLQFLAFANYTVCTFTSNVCRLVYSLRATIPPYTFKGRTYTMDRDLDHRIYYNSEDPERLSYFFAWSYSFPHPCQHWATVSFSPRLKGSEGEVIGPYTTGRRLCTEGSEKKVLINNAQVCRVIFAKYYWSHFRRLTDSHYVFVRDIEPWPGRPLYHFYS